MQHGSPCRAGPAALAVAASLVSLLSACRDITVPVLAPSATPAFSAGGAHSADILCQTAVRTPADRYVAKSFTIAAPAGIADPESPKVSVGVFGWTDGATDPARITVCQIPNTPAAQQWVRRTLLKDQPELNLTHPNANASEVARRVAANVATRRPRGPASDVSINMMVVPSDCDPTYMDACTCDPTMLTCDGYTPVPEDPGPEPPPPPPVDDVIPVTPDPSYEYVPGPPIITCRNQTQYPHLSGNDVSVHGETRCDYPPAAITLRVALSKQRCVGFWIFSWCWFSEKNSVTRTAPAGYSYYDLPLHVYCEPGWWEGKTTHTIAFPPGYYPAVGSVTTYSLYDLIVRWC